MSRVSRAALLFVEAYAAELSRYVRAAIELEAVVINALKGVGVPIHLVTARAKEIASLRRKVRRKRYQHPATEVTDLIAVRVITYFGHDIDRVERELRGQLEISERKSRDARKGLAEDRFGYRSVHLIARLRPALLPTGKSAIGRRWFEVQIRSILDHAWSEIEHEAVYKSGVNYPAAIKRRFKALAAALEVLEDTFSALAKERETLVSQYRIEYAAGSGRERVLDVARLLAFLEVSRPNAEGWRGAEGAGRPFPPGSAAAAVEMLAGANIQTATDLEMTFATRSFRDACFRFAATEGIAVDSISHLGLVVLAVGATKPRLLIEQFPDMVFSPAVAAAIENTRSRPGSPRSASARERLVT